MISMSLKRTLSIYLAYAFFFTTILTIICMLVEYAPHTMQALQKFGLGGLVLNSVLWSLLFAVAGSTSLLNQHDPIRNHYLLSLLSFLIAPLLVAVMTFVVVPHEDDLFGFSETAIIFFIVQLFFFFRFRVCMKKRTSIAID